MKRTLALLAAACSAVTLVAVVPGAFAAAGGCAIDYRVTSQWPGGFSTSNQLTNLGAPVSTWTLEFDFVDPGQRIAQGWSANWSQNGQHVTATSPSWASPLGSANLGFNGTWTTANPTPVGFKLNGVACSTGTTAPQPPVVALTSPLPNSLHATPNPIHLEASASDPDGTIVKVVFYRDGVQVFEDTAAPYAFDLFGTSVGNHVLQANAYDNSGLVGVSAPVPVSLIAPGPTTPPTTLSGLVVAGVELGCLLL